MSRTSDAAPTELQEASYASHHRDCFCRKHPDRACAAPARAEEGTARVLTPSVDELAPYTDGAAGLEALLTQATAGDVSAAEAALPLATTGEGFRALVRSITGDLYVLDTRAYGSSGATELHMISGTGEVTKLGEGHGTRNADGSWSFTGYFGERTTEGQTAPSAAGPECTGCGAANLAYSIYAVAKCTTIILCVVGNGLSGFVVGTGCDIGFCSGTYNQHSVGENPTGIANCGYTSCTFEIWARDGSSPSVQSIGVSVIWQYPGSASAQRSNGAYANTVGESGYPGFARTGDDRPYYRYVFTFGTADPNWTKCASTLRASITVRWADGAYLTSGYKSTTKSFLTNCPGYRL